MSIASLLAEKEDEFEKDSVAQQFLLGFLRHISTERLKLPEKDALMAGVMLSNFARNAGKEEYANMAYGDLATGEFKWNA